MSGNAFVNFMSRYGYDNILRVLGRNMRDFLNGLDNLHEYLRLSYPKLRPPSFFCDDETHEGQVGLFSLFFAIKLGSIYVVTLLLDIRGGY